MPINPLTPGFQFKEAKLSEAEHSGICTQGLIQAAANLQYKKERELGQHLLAARRLLDHKGSGTQYLKQVHEVMNTPHTHQSLRKYLHPLIEASPQIVADAATDLTPQKIVLKQMLLDELNKGNLMSELVPSADLEMFLRDIGKKIRELLVRTTAVEKKDGKEIARLFLGTGLVLNREIILYVQNNLVKELEEGKKISSPIVTAIMQLRSSTLCLLLRDCYIDEEQCGNDFVEEIERINTLNLQPGHIKVNDAEWIKLGVEAIKYLRAECLTAVHDRFKQFDLHELADMLRNSLSPAEKTNERIFPWGNVSIVLPEMLGQHGHLYYGVDGRKGVSHLTSLPKDASVTQEEQRQIERYLESMTIYNIIIGFSAQACTCFINEDGKMCATQWSKLVPLVREDFTSEEAWKTFQDDDATIRTADAICNQKLIELWNAHPSLFATLPTIDPLLLIPNGTETIVVCRRTQGEYMMNSVDGLECIDVDPMLSSYGITFDDPVGFRLQQPADTASDESNGMKKSEGSANTTATQLSFRDMYPRRFPSYRDFLSILKKMGVETSTQGKGSHTSLHFGGERDTIDMRIRGTTESLPSGIALSILNRLGISEEAFLQALK